MILKITRTICLILFFTFILGIFSVQIKDPDFWWHLKTGEYIYNSGALPATDPFAYTSLSKDPIHPESNRIKFILQQYWLAQLIFFWIYKFFSFQGIIYLRASIFTLIFFLIYKGVRREGLGLYSSLFLLVPLVIVLHTFTGERPQLFSFLFSFCLIFLLEGFRKTCYKQNEQPLPAQGGLSSKTALIAYLLPIPLIMLVWANLHGGFILGVAIMLGYIFGESSKYFLKRFGKTLSAGQQKLFVITGVAAVAATFINPNGFNVIFFLTEFETGLYKKMIIESMSPIFFLQAGFHDAYLIVYFLLLSATVLILLINIKKIDLTDALITTGLAIISLSSSRYIPFFSPVAVLMIARYGLPTFKRLHRLGALRVIREKADLPLSVILIIMLIVVINNSDLFKMGIRANNYPEGAAKFLKNNRIPGNMFNPYVWGGYLIWELYPDYKVFIDGRGLIGEVFFQEVKILQAYPKRFEGRPEWQDMLSAYNINFIMTFSVDNFSGRLVPLVYALLNDPEWHLIYMDNISLIFLRDAPENKELIQRFGLPKEWLWNEVAVEATLKAGSIKNNVNFYLTAGDAFLAARNFRDAMQAFQKALERDPENDIAQKRIGALKTLR
ncbi:MAG: hypothetical protein WC769_10545 [Thermodesulfovibrionales bacterium]|jgi:hypothetical protein